MRSGPEWPDPGRVDYARGSPERALTSPSPWRVRRTRACERLVNKSFPNTGFPQGRVRATSTKRPESNGLRGPTNQEVAGSSPAGRATPPSVGWSRPREFRLPLASLRSAVEYARYQRLAFTSGCHDRMHGRLVQRVLDRRQNRYRRRTPYVAEPMIGPPVHPATFGERAYNTSRWGCARSTSIPTSAPTPAPMAPPTTKQKPPSPDSVQLPLSATPPARNPAPAPIRAPFHNRSPRSRISRRSLSKKPRGPSFVWIRSLSSSNSTRPRTLVPGSVVTSTRSPGRTVCSNS
jgi:hypothetical protein